jgi:hypothetical protein
LSVITWGRLRTFWRRIGRRGHPFYGHPLLSRHGGALAEAARRRVTERAKAKGLRLTPVVFSFHVVKWANEIMQREGPHASELTELARRVAHLIFGIPIDRLEGHLTKDVAFGELRTPTTFRGQLLRASAVGYGGVVLDRATRQFRVVGRAWMWPLLAHELVKGTAELICLHGLNTLDDATYGHVCDLADRIEYEPAMLQAGAELWRRLLPLLPDDRPVAEALMQVARLPPRALDALMQAVVDRPDWARELLAGLPRA